MNWLLALAGVSAMTAGDPGPQSYGGCAAEPDPAGCVVAIAVRQDDEIALFDLIAAGAVETASRQAPGRGRRTVELAARIALAERPPMSATDAQQVLALLSEVEFYDSGLPEDGRAVWLWPIALSAPVKDLEVRERLIFAAGRAERSEDLRKLIAEAPLGGRWSDDQRASFASVVARMGWDWRAAEAWLASGGERAEGYDVPGIRREIDLARLLEGYDAAAARRVGEGLITDEELAPWFVDDLDALKAAGASEEMRQVARILVTRGRQGGRSFEERTEDLGAASMFLEAAGDRDAALDAAREGAALASRAVGQRLSGRRNSGRLSPAQAAEAASGFGTLPVERLYIMGARDEALANGYLAGRDRYLAELAAGGVPDPEWVAGPRVDYQLKLIVPALAHRGAAREAAALLSRVQSDPEARAEAGGEELMMLAAVAGDAAGLDAIFAEEMRELDTEDSGAWTAIQLVIGRRAAVAALAGDQSP